MGFTCDADTVSKDAYRLEWNFSFYLYLPKGFFMQVFTEASECQCYAYIISDIKN